MSINKISNLYKWRFLFKKFNSLIVNCNYSNVNNKINKQDDIKKKSVNLLRFHSGGVPTTNTTNSVIPLNVVNRPQRQEPGKVHLGFIPDEWIEFFVPKTGYTGFYTFLFTLTTYLVSKEIYVLDEEYYIGLSQIIYWIVAIKYLGPKLARYLDKGIDEYEQELNENKKLLEEHLKYLIKQEEKEQWRIEGQLILLEAKKENVRLQLEAEMRKRQMQVYHEVKRRLDFQVYLETRRQRFMKINCLEWVFKEAKATAPAEIKDYVSNMSITDVAKFIDKN